MSTPRIRPTFARKLAGTPDTFYRELERSLGEVDGICLGSRYGEGTGGGALLRLRTTERHVWSPALHLHLEVDVDGAWSVHGRFSPSSPVWTAFVAIYLVLGCAAIGAASYGGAQMIMDETPWAFVGVPIALALAGFTYGAAFIGQGLGAEDMYELRSFVERVAASAGAAGQG